jgi:5-methylcytosine-specific restriction enzyme subunit McrC
MRSVHQIREFGIISVGNDSKSFGSNELEIDKSLFDELISFIEANEQNSEIDKAFSIFRKNGKRFIRVKNYVGVIETRSGLVLEILPKTYLDENSDAGESRAILLKLLKALKNSPFIKISGAHLKEREDLPLLEVFIKAYLDELGLIMSRGLRGGYVTHVDEVNFLKGKLLVPQTLKRNQTNQARFYCEFDDFSLDIAPNRLIKSTLELLIKTTKSSINKKKALKAYQGLEIVKASLSIDRDLLYCDSNKKLLVNYGNLISWSEIFLRNKSFMSFHGNTINQAILFPMEKLFENYIASLVKKYCKDIKVSTQDRRFSLLGQKINSDDHAYSLKRFQLKPDIVLNDYQVILDTKWKILDITGSRDGIQEGDIYQMHAYGHGYKQVSNGIFPRLGLIYPKCDTFLERLPQMRYGKEALLDVVPFDFSNKNPGDEIRSIINHFLS